MPERIAILCSDLHLSHNPPVARSGESDWYEAMARPLRELRDLAGGLPVICGGDVFDRWNSPPKLINFAIRELPPSFWSVMGQHDLPYHSWEERKSSAFWTLVEADRIGFDEMLSGLDKGKFGWLNTKLAMAGFNWAEKILPASEFPRSKLAGIKLCVAHSYVWYADAKHPQVADQTNGAGQYLGRLKGYDVALFGDNHKGFLKEFENVRIFNAGTFMRRSSDEEKYRPMIGILHEDGTIVRHFLDTSRDLFLSTQVVEEAEQMILHLDSFLEELRSLGETGLDFRRAVEHALEERQASKAVRRIVLEAMEEK